MATTSVRVTNAKAEKAKELAAEVGRSVLPRVVHDLGVDLVAQLPPDRRKQLIRDYALAAEPSSAQ